MFLKTNSIEIDVGGVIYDSLDDFKLAIQNTDNIGDAVAESDLVFIPGRIGPAEYAEKLYGGPVYQYRPVKYILGGIGEAEEWDERISRYRNLFHGKIIKITPKTMRDWYVTGRATIENFDRKRGLGTFELNINYAYPYMLKTEETILTKKLSMYGVPVICKNNEMKVIPEFVSTGTFSATFRGHTETFDGRGKFKSPYFQLDPGDNEIILKGSSSVSVDIIYREGRL